MNLLTETSRFNIIRVTEKLNDKRRGRISEVKNIKEKRISRLKVQRKDLIRDGDDRQGKINPEKINMNVITF